jgi:hypothetical protein
LHYNNLTQLNNVFIVESEEFFKVSGAVQIIQQLPNRLGVWRFVNDMKQTSSPENVEQNCIIIILYLCIVGLNFSTQLSKL